MPRARDFPAGANAAVLDQLANVFDVYGSLGAAAGAVNAVAPVEVWSLAADAALQPSNDLRELATRTGDWLHVISMGGSQVGHAISQPGGPLPEDWKVTTLSISPSAEKILDRMKWLNANAPADAEVRFLMLPELYLTAFWLIDGADQFVVIIDCPKNRFSALRDRFVTSFEFLQAIRVSRVITGLVFF